MITEKLSAVWDRLNPSEPSATYLMKLMAFMLACFVGGLLIGGIPETEHPEPMEAVPNR